MNAPREQTVPQAVLEQNTSLDIHPRVFTLFFTGFLIMMIALFVVFRTDGAALAMVIISAVYGVLYFGIPLIGSQAARYEGSWRAFLNQEIQTYTGPLTGKSMLIQICTLPAMVCCGVIINCVVLSLFM